jgi:DNA helicase II / ATP-dependent DNA helicase PcrA
VAAGFKLSPEQQEVVSTRGCPLQVIACAGSGKTESVSRRVASLIGDGEPPESIVAFTFTEKAALELKERIYKRVEDIKGSDFLGRLGPMHVGTIHAYCFRILQDYVPKYGNYEVLDEHRHSGILSREHKNLNLSSLKARHWEPIRDFMKTADVIGNELIDPALVAGEPVGACYASYMELLERYHLLTFNQIIALTVAELEKPEVHKRVHGPLRHLIVDEYQDINPAQERLIELLSRDPVQLCVVGDDDQAIYQWRGSDVQNILTFASRKAGTKTVRLETNRRSRKQIVNCANDFANSIGGRLSKAMKPVRVAGTSEIVPWMADRPEDEAETIAKTIGKLHGLGYRYGDIAVLFRSVRTAAPVLVEALGRMGIPYNCGGRTGLFVQPEVSLFGELFSWMADGTWRDERYGESRDADIDNVVAGINAQFGGGVEIPGLKKYFKDWKSIRKRPSQSVSLIGDFYQILRFIGAEKIDPDTPAGSARFGALARFSTVLADFEHVTRRGRYVEEGGSRVFRSGRDRGKPFYQKLNSYLLYYAKDAYEDFAGEQTLDVDAVDILTVHQSKGLEWPVVFMPSLTSKRFPSMFSGRSQEWLIPEAVFPSTVRSRYEGGDAEERRLFYVAMTRARDCLYLSCFQRMKNAMSPSPYLEEVAKPLGGLKPMGSLPLPAAPEKIRGPESPLVESSFSDLASYDECPYRYRLARIFGFEQELAIELGFGNALHHVLRIIAEQSRASGRIPTKAEATDIVEEEFYLPFADSATFKRMHRSSKLLVENYLKDYHEDLMRVWATERPFEIHLDDGSLAGRADIILDEEGGQSGHLAIVDYKTAADPLRDARYEMQIAVYAEAARGEGLDVHAGYLHELRSGTRKSVDIGKEKSDEAIAKISTSMKGIRTGTFAAAPAEDKCGSCDYQRVCRHNTAPII